MFSLNWNLSGTAAIKQHGDWANMELQKHSSDPACERKFSHLSHHCCLCISGKLEPELAGENWTQAFKMGCWPLNLQTKNPFLNHSVVKDLFSANIKWTKYILYLGFISSWKVQTFINLAEFSRTWLCWRCREESCSRHTCIVFRDAAPQGDRNWRRAPQHHQKVRTETVVCGICLLRNELGTRVSPSPTKYKYFHVCRLKMLKTEKEASCSGWDWSRYCLSS